MSFPTKSSRDPRVLQMSFQANITFKTISLFGTHDGERNTSARRAACAQLHEGSIARHVVVCRRCRLIEACARRSCVPARHPQLLRSVGESAGELTGIARAGCRRRAREIVRSMVCTAAARCAHPNGGCAHDADRRRMCARMRWKRGDMRNLMSKTTSGTGGRRLSRRLALSTC